MKKTLFAIAAVAALAAPQIAAAQDTGNWIIRARAVDLLSSNTNNGTLKATLDAATTLTNATVSINDKWLPEVDISYFFTPNLAAELILTYPQKQSVYAEFTGGSAKIGSFKHLPPTLTAQYHFTDLPGFRPYVGAGINYTFLSNVKVTVPGAVATGGSDIDLNLRRHSFGLAAQLGADVPVGGGWLVNLDAKYVQIGTDVKLADGTKVGKFNVDPWLLSVGFGKRF
jgi:outer membrane protein